MEQGAGQGHVIKLRHKDLLAQPNLCLGDNIQPHRESRAVCDLPRWLVSSSSPHHVEGEGQACTPALHTYPLAKATIASQGLARWGSNARSLAYRQEPLSSCASLLLIEISR